MGRGIAIIKGLGAHCEVCGDPACDVGVVGMFRRLACIVETNAVNAVTVVFDSDAIKEFNDGAAPEGSQMAR